MSAKESLLSRRRSVLLDEIERRYGVTMHADPRAEHIIRVSKSDYETFVNAVMNDRKIDAIGRGYYLGLGGELDLVTSPDWTFDPLSVALLRLRVVLLGSWARPIVRRISRWFKGGAS